MMGCNGVNSRYLVIKYYICTLSTLVGICIGFTCKIFLFVENMSLKHLQIYVLGCNSTAIDRGPTLFEMRCLLGPESGFLMLPESVSLKDAAGVVLWLPVSHPALCSLGEPKSSFHPFRCLGDSQFLSSQQSKKQML